MPALRNDRIFRSTLKQAGKTMVAWSKCSRERERVEADPLAHARGYSEDEEDEGNWYRRGLITPPGGCDPCLLRRPDTSATSHFFTDGTVIMIVVSSAAGADAVVFGSVISGALMMGEGEDEGKAED